MHQERLQVQKERKICRWKRMSEYQPIRLFLSVLSNLNVLRMSAICSPEEPD